MATTAPLQSPRGSGNEAASLLIIEAEEGKGSPPARFISFDSKWTVLGLILAGWFVAGFLFYTSEGYDAVSALYALVQIVTTVGYGDLLPTTESRRMEMAALILTSTAIVAGVVSNFFDLILDKQAADLMEKIQSTQEAISSGADVSKIKETKQDPIMKILHKLYVSAGIFAIFIAAGTLFYGYYEQCSCSYGHSRIDGCKDDMCSSTGGVMKNFEDTFYMSVVTLTTVGFGDVTAVSWEGRLFGIFWIFLGVGSMVNFVGDVTELIQSKKEQAKRTKITKSLFAKMDSDGSGTLDKVEFLTLQLEINGMAKKEEIDCFLKEFDELDRSKDGSVSVDECKEWFL